MSAIESLLTSGQLQEVIDAVTSKTKLLFVPRSTYLAKISELESTIGDLTARIEAVENPQQTEEFEDNEPMEEG